MADATPTQSSRAMIETENLGLRIGDFLSLHEVNLRVERGEIYGLVGPLGSGKSSTLKLLAGMMAISDGRAWVDGLDVAAQNESVRSRIGYMPGYMGAFDDLRVRDYLEFFAQACRVVPSVAEPRIEQLLDLAGLLSQADLYMSALDAESRRRLAVVKADIHDPPVLLFDEPALGLPNSARIRLRGLIGQLAAMGGKTVLICTNILTDVVGLCHQLGIMRGGHLINTGPAAAIAHSLTGARILELETAGPAEALMERLTAHPAIHQVTAHGANVLASLSGEIEDPGEVVREIIASGASVTSFREHQLDPDLLLGQLIQTRTDSASQAQP